MGRNTNVELLGMEFDEKILSGEQRLWIEVLVCGLRDALRQERKMGTRDSHNINLTIHQAKQWIYNSSDFNMVCALAGLNHEWVRMKFVKCLEDFAENPNLKLAWSKNQTATHRSSTERYKHLRERGVGRNCGSKRNGL